MADVRGAGGRILDQSVRPKASSIADKSVSTPLGDAPMIPVLLIVSGLYLCWFAVHYWAGDIAWPSDPVKALLTGKPLPVPDKGKAIKTELAKLQTQDTHVMTPAEIAQLGQSTADAKLNPGLSAGGVLAGSAAIAADALLYKGQGYVFGGPADRVGNWDCSSFASWVLSKDLGHKLPGGGKYGDPGYPPNAHGPTTLDYLLYGTAVARGQVQAGDLVVSSTHMGICISPTQYVSARTPALGVGVDNLSDPFPGGSPVFRRVV